MALEKRTISISERTASQIVGFADGNEGNSLGEINVSARIANMVEVATKLIDLSWKEVVNSDINEKELLYLIDTCNGVIFSSRMNFRQELSFECLEGAGYGDYLNKWGVDHKALSVKILGLTEAQAYAIVSKIYEFWNNSPAGDMKEDFERVTGLTFPNFDEEETPSVPTRVSRDENRQLLKFELTTLKKTLKIIAVEFIKEIGLPIPQGNMSIKSETLHEYDNFNNPYTTADVVMYVDGEVFFFLGFEEVLKQYNFEEENMYVFLDLTQSSGHSDFEIEKGIDLWDAFLDFATEKLSR